MYMALLFAGMRILSAIMMGLYRQRRLQRANGPTAPCKGTTSDFGDN